MQSLKGLPSKYLEISLQAMTLWKNHSIKIYTTAAHTEMCPYFKQVFHSLFFIANYFIHPFGFYDFPSKIGLKVKFPTPLRKKSLISFFEARSAQIRPLLLTRDNFQY